MKKEDLQNAQQGTGSAENIGKDRNAQKNTMTNIDKNQREDIAQQAGLGRDRLTDVEDLGDLSGRDDYAGGDRDDMNEHSTNERTER